MPTVDYASKRLTTHGAEQRGVVDAIADTRVALDSPGLILAHGTTLVINSLLERRGANIALVTTAGFADILDIGRGNRPEGFALRYQRDPAIVPVEQRFELAERTVADGTVSVAPGDDELAELAHRIRGGGADAVAVCLLNSYRNPANERAVADLLRQAIPGLPVTISSDLGRQSRVRTVQHRRRQRLRSSGGRTLSRCTHE